MAERDYMRIFIGGQSHMIADSMAAMQKRMRPMGFRAHPSQRSVPGGHRRAGAPPYGGMLAVRLEDGN